MQGKWLVKVFQEASRLVKLISTVPGEVFTYLLVAGALLEVYKALDVIAVAVAHK